MQATYSLLAATADCRRDSLGGAEATGAGWVAGLGRVTHIFAVDRRAGCRMLTNSSGAATYKIGLIRLSGGAMPFPACPHVLAPGDVPAREPGGRVPPNSEQTTPGYSVFPPRHGGDQGDSGAATHSDALEAHKPKPAVCSGQRARGVGEALEAQASPRSARIIRTWATTAAGDGVHRRPTGPNARIPSPIPSCPRRSSLACRR